MQKIKAIQQGYGDEAIYYCTSEIHKNKYPSLHVDEIQKNIVDKELIYDKNWYPNGFVQHYAYRGYKNSKLVFEMFNPDLITYETD